VERKRRRPTAPNPLRLSINDTELVLRGAAYISAKYATSPLRQGAPDSRAPVTPTGRYDQQFMQTVLRIGHAMYLRGSGGRFPQLNCFDLAACAFAVRVTLLRLNRREIRVSTKYPDRAARRLLARLETARKRAKRAFIQEFGPDVYRERADNWRLFVRWMRWYFLDGYGVVSRRGPSLLRKHQRQWVATLMDWARSALIARESPVPPDAELRRLVRMAVRYVRRMRTGFFNVPDLVRNKGDAAVWLAKFIEVRMDKWISTTEEKQ
jgi:hypothetical protein